MDLSTESASPCPATADYLRRARRVRARFAHDPVTMHRKLNALSAAKVTAVEVRKRVRRVVTRLPEAYPFQSHPAVAEAFADEVERSLEGGVLRYSRRAALLRQARRRGIGRFEANLIIATVQHRRKSDAVAPQVEAEQVWDARLQVVLTVVVVQSLIVLAVWWVLLR